MRIEPQLTEWITKETDGIVGICEANSFERLTLWCQYQSEWDQRGRNGSVTTIGVFDDRPITISILVNVVKGKRIMFYEATSQLVDYKMVEDFIAHHWPGVQTTDAMNFSNILR